ncbi:hypothetical protein L2719_19780 [Shewanella schlegeliana]|uniref:Uncharacterized protein n=1 Tax=Shewanella schlegeliana TaxID=190308 RepID=A0ABS1SSN5_9GAMM|nr:hypothetical protein [Shewanella schlegeliana]MBL4911550.1 hypothetical protein [Shewanella schlegeliana]MCL1111765.1 hypothetical protein [Shewanella schlegeliana]GIU36011.1 hypothetical protein TUM4433_34160 [Shewanella schlegeliana]
MTYDVNTIAVMQPLPQTEGQFVVTHHLIELPLLENVLTFPSGLSVKQAKDNAEKLKMEQSISYEEALRYICWGNGVHNVQSFNEALPKLVKSTFGIEHTEFGLYSRNGVYKGYWWVNGSGINHMEVSVPNARNIGEALTQLLIEKLTYAKKNQSKQVAFLEVVKDCLTYLGRGYTLAPHLKRLDEVKDIYEIDLDIRKLIFGCKGNADRLLSYALASCYNTRDTTALMMSQSLADKSESLEITKIDLANEDEREQIARGFRYPQFGDMCMQLDDAQKDILKRLLENYQGW